MRKKILLLMLLILVPLFSSTAARKSDELSILLLFSYHPGHTWEDSVYIELLRELSENIPSSQITLEYMDSKRNEPEAVEEGVYGKLSSYDQDHFSIVVAVDDNAIQFMAGRGSSLFPDADIVFCGVNDYGLVKDRLRPGHTGVVSRVNLADTLALAKKLIPKLE
ncbi:MAG: hypothetical protein PQJ50_08275, partial [Spirochaetales bacterium]|nr:hypothetical protein [Spirochaetales bacterium]